MSVLNLTRDYLDELWELRDPRADAYPLTDSPWPTIYMCLAYLAFVNFLGPYYMRNRPAYDLKGPMMAYNAFQVAYSAWHASLALKGGWWNHYSFRCEPCNYSATDPRALLMLQAYWHYFFSKFLDFSDTVFFILRKKNEQVTFLHVAHHCIMPLFLWPVLRFMPGGHGTLAGLLNAGIHVVMYSYYFLAALGPSVRPYLWWKRYLTVFQMVQFLIIFVHQAQLLFQRDSCGFPREYAYYGCSLMTFFLCLFGNFYVNAYSSDDKKKSVKQQ